MIFNKHFVSRETVFLCVFDVGVLEKVGRSLRAGLYGFATEPMGVHCFSPSGNDPYRGEL